MPDTTEPRRRGRWAESLRNDDAVLDAARDVLRVDPGASMARIAAAAAVGVGSLYRRYPDREALVHRVCLDGLLRIEALARAAIGDLDTHDAEPWAAFSTFLADALDAGAGSFVHLAGTFTPTDELFSAAERRHESSAELLHRVQTAGAVRADLTDADIELMLEQLQTVHVADPARVHALRHRYLRVLLDGLRAEDASPLLDTPARWDDIRDRWRRSR